MSSGSRALEFIGRHHEMETLTTALDNGLSGLGRLVMVAGEPGNWLALPSGGERALFGDGVTNGKVNRRHWHGTEIEAGRAPACGYIVSGGRRQ